jgi:hydrogenase expression/formation protein HypE
VSDTEKRFDFSKGLNCPVPKLDHDTVQLAHGSGGKLMGDLIEHVFRAQFNNEILDQMEDQARIVPPPGQDLVFTTDSFVVHPLFFPGGNIGDLAVHGTVNDLCMSGAVPAYLSVGFIIEEGLPIDDLLRIVQSMKNAADAAGVQIVTGDTKVVNKGSCDKVFINTSGIGFLAGDLKISASKLKAGDAIIVSGTLADHGMAIMTQRENLSFQSDVVSDSAALNSLVDVMLKVSSEIHAMRDPTRGGLAATLNEFAVMSGMHIQLDDSAVPVRPNVRACCEILGIDPMHVANEGKLVAAVAPEVAEDMVRAMRAHPLGKDAAVIGTVSDDRKGLVSVKTILGTERVIDLPMGEILPRIC